MPTGAQWHSTGHVQPSPQQRHSRRPNETVGWSLPPPGCLSQAIPELKYSPRGGKFGMKMLAAAAADLTIYVYRADRNYQLVSK
jgi:hypothetical protein